MCGSVVTLVDCLGVMFVGGVCAPLFIFPTCWGQFTEAGWVYAVVGYGLISGGVVILVSCCDHGMINV